MEIVTLETLAHSPHVCRSANGFIVQDLWRCKRNTWPRLVLTNATRVERGIVGIGGLKAGLTNVLGGTQDLPDLCDVVHASGQAKVHNANVPQRSGTGQQDVLGLEEGSIMSSLVTQHCQGVKAVQVTVVHQSASSCSAGIIL